MKRIDGEGTSYEGINLHIVEVYYQDNGSVIGWTQDTSPCGESLAELRQNLDWMMESLDKPILVEKDLLAEAELARANGETEIFPSGQLSLDEILNSLGLQRGDVEGTNLNKVVLRLEPEEIEETGESSLLRMSTPLSTTEQDENILGQYPGTPTQPTTKPAVEGAT
jgi:hypothetical protein